MRVRFYDRDGALYKVETFGEVQSVDGHPLPTRVEMDDVQTDAKSVLHLRNIRLGQAVDEKLFSDSPLRRPAAH